MKKEKQIKKDKIIEELELRIKLLELEIAKLKLEKGEPKYIPVPYPVNPPYSPIVPTTPYKPYEVWC